MSILPLATIPLYQQINLGVVALSVAIVLIVCIIGAKQRGYFDGAPTIPSEGIVFPAPVDYLYTILIIGLITLLNVSSAFEGDTSAVEDEGALATWLDPMLFFAIHIPIILRLFQTRNLQTRVRIGFGASVGYIALAFLITFVSNGMVQLTPLLDWFTKVCGSPEIQEALTVFEEYHWQELLPHIVLACVVAPIVEECLFRGMLYPCLKKFVKPAMAAVLCGLLFGAIHMALPQLVALMVLGTFLCVVYERVKSLWLPILIHACFNSFSVVIAIFYKDIEAYIEVLEKAS